MSRSSSPFYVLLLLFLFLLLCFSSQLGTSLIKSPARYNTNTYTQISAAVNRHNRTKSKQMRRSATIHDMHQNAHGSRNTYSHDLMFVAKLLQRLRVCVSGQWLAPTKCIHTRPRRSHTFTQWEAEREQNHVIGCFIYLFFPNPNMSLWPLKKNRKIVEKLLRVNSHSSKSGLPRLCDTCRGSMGIHIVSFVLLFVFISVCVYVSLCFMHVCEGRENVFFMYVRMK